MNRPTSPRCPVCTDERCPLCAPSWPPARTGPRLELGTAAALVVLAAAAGTAIGYALGRDAL